MSLQDLLRRLPSVDALASDPALADAVARHGRALVVARSRHALDALRSAARRGEVEGLAERAASLPEEISQALDAAARGSLVDVLNATGVIVHTNLGRAPLGPGVLRRVAEGGAGAVNLEIDLESGRRGKRAQGCESLLRELTGAEAACVVNNCAAALMLALNTFASGRRVLVSRGELVEIGGSFRIPAICERSGARLTEVGTTNRTRAADYAEALEGGDVGLILKVHPSNFRVVGFTEEASLRELVDVGRRAGVPVLMDQGSGALEDLAPWGVDDEPPVPALVATGVDLVAFSGDKLLGGPQAGCMAGRSAAVEACRANPMFRALRVGRLTALALEATLWAHRSRRFDDVPVQAQLRLGADAVRARAEALVPTLARACEAAGVRVEIVPGDSTSGGGSSPTSRVPTFLLRLHGGREAGALSAALRRGVPAVVARVAEDALLLDLRTIDPARDADLAGAVIAAVSGGADGD
jgi:L-seryl-tRNA(Ser) seleniumtransferase